MTAAALPVSSDVPTPADLKNVSTRDLLVALFERYKEAIFIGHADDKVNPVQIACHFPAKMTGMHSVLTGALERVLTGIKRKYPDVPACEDAADAYPTKGEKGNPTAPAPVLAAPAVGPAAFVFPVAPLAPGAFPAATVPVVGTPPYRDSLAARTRLRDNMDTRLGSAVTVGG